LKDMQEYEPGTVAEAGLFSALVGAGCRCGEDSHHGEEQDGLALGRERGGCGGCTCGEDHLKACGFGVEDGVLAAVWVPMNRFDGIYDKETAWRRGTMFAALDKPFYGEREVDCRGNER